VPYRLAISQYVHTTNIVPQSRAIVKKKFPFFGDTVENIAPLPFWPQKFILFTQKPLSNLQKYDTIGKIKGRK
jgi:hypothetical protein